jgi:hypothetical protein
MQCCSHRCSATQTQQNTTPVRRDAPSPVFRGPSAQTHQFSTLPCHASERAYVPQAPKLLPSSQSGGGGQTVSSRTRSTRERRKKKNQILSSFSTVRGRGCRIGIARGRNKTTVPWNRNSIDRVPSRNLFRFVSAVLCDVRDCLAPFERPPGTHHTARAASAHFSAFDPRRALEPLAADDRAPCRWRHLAQRSKLPRRQRPSGRTQRPLLSSRDVQPKATAHAQRAIEKHSARLSFRSPRRRLH